jgi:hypothetical protein
MIIAEWNTNTASKIALARYFNTYFHNNVVVYLLVSENQKDSISELVFVQHSI